MPRRASRLRGGASLAEIEELYVRVGPRLRGVAAVVAGDRQAAEDIVQDAFAQAIRKRGTFARKGTLEAWMWRVCINAARNRGRRERSRQLLQDRVAEQVRETQVGTPSWREARLRAAVAGLPERQRVALFLCYYADLDYGSIARALGIRIGTVGKLLHDARSELRRVLEEG